VTHDVDEAIRLADRVAVLRAGKLVTDEPVTADRPRDPADPAFARLRRRLLADLGVELTEPAKEPIS
jgi:sulfonate transport system ATP-binding protein